MGATYKLWMSRPHWLQVCIDDSFAIVADPSHDGYAILASEEYAFGDIAGSDLVAACFAEFGEDPTGPRWDHTFRLLDVGAGEGRFISSTMQLLRQGHGRQEQSSQVEFSAVGISARVYKSTLATDSASDMEIRATNVENILKDDSFHREVQSGALYSCIVSAETFRHLCDPLGTLCQLFSLLTVGGVLAVDRLHVQGLGSAQQLMDWWREVGYQVEGEVSGERVAPLFLRRTHAFEVLYVPVRYVQVAPTSASALRGASYQFADDTGDDASCIAKRLHQGSGRNQSQPAPWTRVVCKGPAHVPLPQWKLTEMMLKRLVTKC